MTKMTGMLKFNCPFCQHLMEVPKSARGTKGLCPECKSTLSVPDIPETKQADPSTESAEKIVSRIPEADKTYRAKQHKKAQNAIIKMKSGQSNDEKHKESPEQKQAREDKFKKLERRLQKEEKQSENNVISFKTGLFIFVICLSLAGLIFYKTRPEPGLNLLSQVKQIQKRADRNFRAKDYQIALPLYKEILKLIKGQASQNEELKAIKKYAEKQLISCKEKLISDTQTQEKTKTKQSSKLKPPGF